MMEIGINLRQILERMPKKRKRVKLPKPSKRNEAWYRDNLQSIISTLQNMAIDVFNKTILTDAPRKPPSDAEIRQQSRRKLSKAIERLSAADIDRIAPKLAYEMARRANEQNKRLTVITYKACFGVDLTGLLSDKFVKKKLAQAVAENVKLISSIKNNFIKDIGDRVSSHLLNGGRHEDIIPLIQARGDVSLSRATLIARDQTSKLNSDLSRVRAESLGLDLYEWSGSDDERERDSHRVLNGKTCKYSDPTVYSDDGGKTWKPRSAIGAFIGNPGDDYQCRCVGIPVIPWD